MKTIKLTLSMLPVSPLLHWQGPRRSSQSYFVASKGQEFIPIQSLKLMYVQTDFDKDPDPNTSVFCMNALIVACCWWARQPATFCQTDVNIPKLVLDKIDDENSVHKCISAPPIRMRVERCRGVPHRERRIGAKMLIIMQQRQVSIIEMWEWTPVM